MPAFSQGFADKLMERYNIGFGDAVLLGGLARDFGVDDSLVFDMRNRYGYNDDDLLTALTLQRYGRRDRDDIYRMRRSGMGWGEIAHSIGMHPGDFNKARKNGKFGSDRDVFGDIWRDRLNQRKAPSSDIDWALSQGIKYRDAYIADQIARARNFSLRGLLDNFRRYRNWSDKRTLDVNEATSDWLRGRPTKLSPGSKPAKGKKGGDIFNPGGKGKKGGSIFDQADKGKKSGNIFDTFGKS